MIWRGEGPPWAQPPPESSLMPLGRSHLERLAAAGLRSADPRRNGVLRKLAPASGIVVNGVLLGIGGAVFLLRSVSRFTGGVLRLILTLRRI